VLLAACIRDERVKATVTAPATSANPTADAPRTRERLPLDRALGPMVAARAASVEGIGPDGRDEVMRGAPVAVGSTTTRDAAISMMRVLGAPLIRVRKGASAWASALALSKR